MKKNGVELQTKATKNNKDSNLGLQHNCWVEERPPCSKLFVGDLINLDALLKLASCFGMHTYGHTYTYVHTCLFFTKLADVFAVCVFLVSMIYL